MLQQPRRLAVNEGYAVNARYTEPFIIRSFKFGLKCVKFADQINFFMFKNIFSAASFINATSESASRGSIKRVLKNQVRKVQDISSDGFYHVFTWSALTFRIHALGSAILCAKDILVDGSKATIYTLASISTLFLISSLNMNMQENWWKVLFDINATIFCLLDIISRRISMALLIIPSLTLTYYTTVSLRAFFVTYWNTIIIDNRIDIEAWINESPDNQQLRREFFQSIRNPNYISDIIQIAQRTPNFIENLSSLIIFVLRRQMIPAEAADQNPLRILFNVFLNRLFPEGAQRERFRNILQQRVPDFAQMLNQIEQGDFNENPEQLFERFAEMYSTDRFERAQRNSRGDVPFLREKLAELNLTVETQGLFERLKGDVDPAYISSMATFATYMAISTDQRANLRYVKNNSQWAALCSQYDEFTEQQQEEIQKFYNENFDLLLSDKNEVFLERLLATPYHQFFQDLFRYSNEHLLQSNQTFSALLSQL